MDFGRKGGIVHCLGHALEAMMMLLDQGQSFLEHDDGYSRASIVQVNCRSCEVKEGRRAHFPRHPLQEIEEEEVSNSL